MLQQIIKKAKSLYFKERAEHSKYFFKTAPGQYGAGDVFWGLSVPEMRKIARDCQELDLKSVTELLRDMVHELRLIGLTILVEKYKKAKDDKERKMLYDFYLKNRAGINNWDLVDLSVYKIMGDYLLRHKEERKILYQFIKSRNLWERRLAMVSCMAFIRFGETEDTIKLATALLNDNEDLMHKASGWMLRELGKRNKKVLINFLNSHITEMPRTMLRYAIEKFSEEERQKYLKIKRQKSL